MKKVGSFIGDWWRLVVPYFKSEERWIAIPLLVGAISLTLSRPSAWKCCSTTGTGASTTASRTRTKPVFWREITIFSVVGGRSSSRVGVSRAVVSPYLRLRWRRWLTRRYLAHWLDGRGYYRIELQRTDRQRRPAHRRGPAAARRIHHDARCWACSAPIATLISFLFILWNLSGPLSLAPIGLDVTIPGYMVWVA